jgi:hypothetical protein
MIRIRISIFLLRKERTWGIKSQFPSTLRGISLPGTERPYRGHRSRFTTRSFPPIWVPLDFAALSSFPVFNIFALSLSEETKAKLNSKVFRDRGHIGMSHVLIEYFVPRDLD